jgi:hypothetical protein
VQTACQSTDATAVGTLSSAWQPQPRIMRLQSNNPHSAQTHNRCVSLPSKRLQLTHTHTLSIVRHTPTRKHTGRRQQHTRSIYCSPWFCQQSSSPSGGRPPCKTPHCWVWSSHHGRPQHAAALQVTKRLRMGLSACGITSHTLCSKHKHKKQRVARPVREHHDHHTQSKTSSMGSITAYAASVGAALSCPKGCHARRCNTPVCAVTSG